MHAVIKQATGELSGTPASCRVTVLYGGSVSRAIAAALMREDKVDGLFVGRAAWDVSGFINLIELVEHL